MQIDHPNNDKTCSHCAVLMAELKELFAADDAYGTGFYNTDRWRDAYDRLKEMTDEFHRLRDSANRVKEASPLTRQATTNGK